MSWDEIERTGHNPTTYLDAAEEHYYESGQWLADELKKDLEQDRGCWNCMEYDGDRCMKYWNNAEPEYYIPDRDDKEPDDKCDDWELNPDADYRDYLKED